MGSIAMVMAESKIKARNAFHRIHAKSKLRLTSNAKGVWRFEQLSIGEIDGCIDIPPHSPFTVTDRAPGPGAHGRTTT